jgi:hypothetical protein
MRLCINEHLLSALCNRESSIDFDLGIFKFKNFNMLIHVVAIYTADWW